VAAAARVISAIDKARAEVVIDVELLEVDRSRLKEYGLQIASPGSPGINGSIDVNREGLTLNDVANLTRSDVFLYNVPGLYYKLLKSDANTRTLANPQLRTSEGIPAQARFGERVPVPVTVFAPIATGGISQQPITSFNYENIGVNIDITPRIHHNDDVSLAMRVELSNISGTGYQGLPTFGNRQVSTTIRLRDGETNMLAGLIRDEERDELQGVPGLSDLPVIGRLFAANKIESKQTDIILVLTPHIVRVLDLTEADLRPFRIGRAAAAPALGLEAPVPALPPPPEIQEPDAAAPRPPAQAPGPVTPITPPASKPAERPPPE
jgi:general secretion pathway protein D